MAALRERSPQGNDAAMPPRVVLLRDDHGSLRLIELEVIEADLYLQTSTTGAAAFAAAVAWAAIHR